MRVVTFGEILLRLAPIGYKKLFQGEILESTFCGSEANVAVSLANYGVDVAFVSKVPSNEVGQAAINSLRYFGVDVSRIVRGGERLGLYYLEKGASQRPSKVIYDRAGSAIGDASLNDFDWDNIFDGCKWFHFSGINPALSDEMHEICVEACNVAKKKGIMISCDLNFRKKLWSNEKANKLMSQLMTYVDVCIGNEEDTHSVFGIEAENTNVYKGVINHEGYLKVAEEVSKKFGCKYVAITMRESLSASLNNWSGMLYSSEVNECYYSKEYSINIVDRVGSGDSFAAGLIYSFAQNMNHNKAIDFAVGASCLKHSIEGDYNRVGVLDIENLISGDSSGRVQR